MLQVHQRLDDFEIVRLLGKGGMGEVYEALQLHPPRPVALKVLVPWLAADDDALQRFWREAAVPARLDHPGIVRIITTGKTDDGIAYYTMQLVRGLSLAKLIERANELPQPSTAAQLTIANSVQPQETPTSAMPAVAAPLVPLPEDTPPLFEEYVRDRFRVVARVGAKAARALAFAHQQSVLHRDIKPSNLMVDQHGEVYLVDFGLTLALGPDATNSFGGVVRGTPWYMSPEQARGEAVDHRSDLYSLGVTLYELASGGMGPFTVSRHSSEAVLTEVRAGHWLPLHRLAPDVPEALEAIIHRTMDLKPSRRYADAEALAEALEEFLRLPFVPPVRPKRRRLRPFGAAVVAAIGLVALGLLFGASRLEWTKLFGTPITAAVREKTEPAAQPEGAANAVVELFHRERPVHVRIPLLRDDHQPVKQRLVLGQGTYMAARPGGLTLTSPPHAEPTLIALDHPNCSCFEFQIELWQHKSGVDQHNQLGIFFGWHERPPDAIGNWRCFLLQLDESPVLKDPLGRVTVGTSVLQPPSGDQAGRFESIRAFFPPDRFDSLIPLTKLDARAEGWRQLTVRVEQNQIQLIVDRQPPRSYEVEKVLKEDRALAGAFLNPHGLLGIWTCNGQGSFRNATIMALPETEKK